MSASVKDQVPQVPNRLIDKRRTRRCASLVWLLWLLWLVLFFAACGAAWPRGEVVVTERVSPNYTVFVIEDAQGVRRLRFERDGVDQSAVVPGDPDHLVFAYMRGLTAALALRPAVARVLIIGLGGGTLPMFLRHHLPLTIIDVVELDAVVLDVAKQDLGFAEDPRLKVHLADGRAFVEGSTELWDLIVLDAYGKDDIPRHLATRQFYEAVKRRLAPGGLLAANLWSEHASRRYRSLLRTFEAVFPEVHVLAPEESESRIVLAFERMEHLFAEHLVARARALRVAWTLRFDLAGMVRRGHREAGDLPPGGRVLEDRATP